MPFYRGSRFGNRRNYSRYRYRGFGSMPPYTRGTPSMAVNQLKVINGNAVKFHKSYQFTDAADGYDSPHITLLSGIPIVSSGVTVNSRDSALVSPLDLRINLIMNWLEGSACALFRVMIIQWFADSGLSAPQLGTVLNTASTSAANFMNSMQNVDDANCHARVLFDQVFTPPASKEGSHTNHAVPLRISIRNMRRIRFHHDATNGTGHLYLIAFGSNPAANNDMPVTTFDYVLRFLDY